MKNKIVMISLIVMFCLGNSAYAINIDDLVMDRTFSEDRTLYYVKTYDDVFDIEADGYEVIKKATTPAEKNAQITEENVTVLKNLNSGTDYRFVFEKDNKSSIVVTDIDISSEGKLSILGKLSGAESFKAIILKPEEKYSENFFKWEELTKENMAERVLDVIEIKMRMKV